MTSSTLFLLRRLTLGSVWLAWMAWLAQAQSPPRLLSEAYDLERVVPEGTTVQLPCPVEADPDTLFFEWYRDKEPLDAFADERFRMQGNGILKVKSVIPEDTGLYVCRAVNGFGRADVNVTLIVLSSPDVFHNNWEEEQGFSQDNNRMFDDPSRFDEDKDFDPPGKPYFTQTSKFPNSVVQRLVGSSVHLKCIAKGDPRPEISWLKNGKPLPDSNLPSHSRGGHWILYLQNLQASDTGNYTCVAQNDLGSVSASFGVKVIDRVRSKPEFLTSYPLNVTTRVGEEVSLQCLISSDIPPNVQWLKQISKGDTMDPAAQPLKLLGEFFHILKSTEVVERMDGTFLSKLLFKSVREMDRGKYICLGANAMGFSSRSAFLSVLPKLSPDVSLPFPLLIALVICGVLVVAALLGLMVYCRHRKAASAASREVSLAATHTTSSASSKTACSATVERKHSYVGLTYQPHLSARNRREEPGLPSQTRIYTSGQLHRTVPLHSRFL